MVSPIVKLMQESEKKKNISGAPSSASIEPVAEAQADEGHAVAVEADSAFVKPTDIVIKKMTVAGLNKLYTEAVEAKEMTALDGFEKMKKTAKQALLLDAICGVAPTAGTAVATVEQTVEEAVVVDGPNFVTITMGEIEKIESEAELAVAIKVEMDRNNTSDFRIGGFLSKAMTETWYGGHEDLGSYAMEEFGFKPRKAKYLIAIYRNLCDSGLPLDKVMSIGWVKLKECIAFLTETNLDEWVKKAKKLNTAQFLEDARAHKKQLTITGSAASSSSTEAPNVTMMTFKFHDDQKVIVDEALNQAKKEGNTEFNSVALEYALAAYLAGPGKFGSQGENIHGLDDMIPPLKAWFARVKEAAIKDPIEGKTPQDTALTFIFQAFDQVFPDVDMTLNTEAEEG